MFFLLLLFVTVFTKENCTKNHHEWLRDTSLINTTRTLCGIPFIDLLRVNTLRMIEPQNIPWILSAQQSITAWLNLQSFQQNITTHIEKDYLLLSNNLQNVCDNVSQWSLTNEIAISVMRLYRFNQGLIIGEACPTPSFITINQTFYYYQPPDIIALLGQDNITNIFSVNREFYKTQLFLIVSLVSGFILLAVACLFIVMLRNKKKSYRGRLASELNVNDSDPNRGL